MSSIFNDLIKEHGKARVGTTDNPGLEKKWKEYDGDVSILTRKLPIGTPEHKSNNKLRNDYRSMIVDQGVTYFIGNPVSTSLKGEEPKGIAMLDKFQKTNDVEDLDLGTAIYNAVCGYSGRLFYIDKSGEERAMNLPPWEVIFVYDKTTDELQYALIYYKMKIVTVGKDTVEITKVEWYDKNKVYYYIETGNPGSVPGTYFTLDKSEVNNPQPHGFTGVPLVEFLNNNSKKGDFDRVEDLIDGYDRIVSDSQNELEDLRNAYMVFKGLVPGDKEMAQAKLTGAFGSEDPDFDVSFLTKELTGTFHENHKKTLNDNIYRFSKRVDMNDEKFSGATQSGENRKWKMLALENDAVMKERKFTKALRAQYKLLCSSWTKKNVTVNYLDIKYQFTRKLPTDLEYYATIVTQLFGKVPTEILYSILPFIENPKDAVKMMEEELKGEINLDSYNQQDENQDQ